MKDGVEVPCIVSEGAVLPSEAGDVMGEAQDQALDVDPKLKEEVVKGISMLSPEAKHAYERGDLSDVVCFIGGPKDPEYTGVSDLTPARRPT